ncbi:hypothetical protein [Thermococcus henrietii]|uniref:hypothetical protein n=1 Tax=Thermococcus henrietii TaxID=2016361 RepID=UPI001CB795E8|nr:hypothetical protein [Thermococcus henrietii]
MLFEILKEGLFWAALGKPSEVMPFLRGKLLGNGLSESSKRQLEWLLDELERFYERVACCGRVEEKHVRAIRSFHRDIVSVIETDRA